MTDTISPDDLTVLRRRVERLRARLPNARLREFPDSVAPDGCDAEGREYLTIHQIASRLNTTADAAARLLARVESRLDLNGVPVVTAERFDQLLLDLADGRNPSRFL